MSLEENVDSEEINKDYQSKYKYDFYLLLKQKKV